MSEFKFKLLRIAQAIGVIILFGVIGVLLAWRG
jgi:hypothetical protein